LAELIVWLGCGTGTGHTKIGFPGEKTPKSRLNRKLNGSALKAHCFPGILE
jgi:hypothetical protein